MEAAEAGKGLGQHLGRRWWALDQAGVSNGRQRLCRPHLAEERLGLGPQSVLSRGTLRESVRPDLTLGPWPQPQVRTR